MFLGSCFSSGGGEVAMAGGALLRTFIGGFALYCGSDSRLMEDFEAVLVAHGVQPTLEELLE